MWTEIKHGGYANILRSVHHSDTILGRHMGIDVEVGRTQICISFCSYVLTISLKITDLKRVKLSCCTIQICEPGSSDSTVSGYGLDDRTIEVRSPAEAKGFFL
jgi:hypothetical protein